MVVINIIIVPCDASTLIGKDCKIDHFLQFSSSKSHYRVCLQIINDLGQLGFLVALWSLTIFTGASNCLFPDLPGEGL